MEENEGKKKDAGRTFPSISSSPYGEEREGKPERKSGGK